MGETEEGLALLARIPSRGRDDDGMEYGPHVVAAIRGEALASLGRYGEAADVVLECRQIRRRARGRCRGTGALAAASRTLPGRDHRGPVRRGPRADARSGPPSGATAGRRPAGRGVGQIPRPPRTSCRGGQCRAPTPTGPCAGLVRPTAAARPRRILSRSSRSVPTRASIPSSGCGRRRRSTDRSTTRAPSTWPVPRCDELDPTTRLPLKRRSADSLRPCCRRWRVRPDRPKVSPRQLGGSSDHGAFAQATATAHRPGAARKHALPEGRPARTGPGCSVQPRPPGEGA